MQNSVSQAVHALSHLGLRMSLGIQLHFRENYHCASNWQSWDSSWVFPPPGPHPQASQALASSQRKVLGNIGEMKPESQAGAC